MRKEVKEFCLFGDDKVNIDLDEYEELLDSVEFFNLYDVEEFEEEAEAFKHGDKTVTMMTYSYDWVVEEIAIANDRFAKQQGGVY